MTFDIIGWGALNVDRLCQVNEFAQIDGETFINFETKSCGGSASNTIITMAKMGLTTGYIGKIGSDSNGMMMKNYLENNNVDVNHLLVSGGETGEVIGFVDTDGNRKLYVTPKVNDQINVSEINNKYINDTNILHLTSFVGLNSSVSIDTQLEVLDKISSDVKVSFDPGMLYVNRGSDFIDKFLKYTDILLVNENELMLLTQLDDFKSAVEEISKKVEILVVKRSTKGSFIKCGDEEYNVDIFNVNTVDTTGAGDAYNAGFLYGYIKGYSLHESGIIGSYIAALSTTQHGATEAITSCEKFDIDEKIQKVKNQK